MPRTITVDAQEFVNFSNIVDKCCCCGAGCALCLTAAFVEGWLALPGAFCLAAGCFAKPKKVEGTRDITVLTKDDCKKIAACCCMGAGCGLCIAGAVTENCGMFGGGVALFVAGWATCPSEQKQDQEGQRLIAWRQNNYMTMS